MKDRIKYTSRNLKDKLSEFKKDIIDKSYKIKLQEIRISQRKETNKNLDYILSLVEENFFVYINHIPEEQVGKKIIEKEHFEIVFMPDKYFAYFYIETKHEDFFIKKYNLVEK